MRRKGGKGCFSVLGESYMMHITCLTFNFTKIKRWGDSVKTDMEFVQKFTPLDFQVKNFTPSILPNFNSFSKKKTQKMSENGEIYTAGKNFTLPPAVTALTNLTSDWLCSVTKRRKMASTGVKRFDLLEAVTVQVNSTHSSHLR